MAREGMFLILKNQSQVQIKTSVFPSVGGEFKSGDIFYSGKYLSFLKGISFSPTARTIMDYLFSKLHNEIKVPVKHMAISDKLNIPLATVRYHLRSLTTNMFIAMERYHREKGVIASKENKYTLLWHCYYNNLVRLCSIKLMDSPLTNTEMTHAFNKVKEIYHCDKKDLQPVVARAEFNKIINEALNNRPDNISVKEAVSSQTKLVMEYIENLKLDPVWTRKNGAFLLGLGNMLKRRPWEAHATEKTPRNIQIDVLNSLM